MAKYEMRGNELVSIKAATEYYPLFTSTDSIRE